MVDKWKKNIKILFFMYYKKCLSILTGINISKDFMLKCSKDYVKLESF